MSQHRSEESWRERLDRSMDAYRRRTARQRDQRAVFAAARSVGLDRRHAAKLARRTVRDDLVTLDELLSAPRRPQVPDADG